MVHSLNKGKSGEREFARLVMGAIQARPDCADIILKRNLSQSDEGGYDLDGVIGLAIEVKRCEKLSLTKWWHQTIVQAGRQDYSRGPSSVGTQRNKIPVLAYRQNRKPWIIMMDCSKNIGCLKKVGRSGPYVRVATLDEFINWLANYLQKLEE